MVGLEPQSPTGEESDEQKIQRLESQLKAESIRKRGLFSVLIGLAALELSRFLAPWTHPMVAIFGAVFCWVYVLHGLYTYSTQEPFIRKP